MRRVVRSSDHHSCRGKRKVCVLAVSQRLRPESEDNPRWKALLTGLQAPENPAFAVRS